MRVLALLVVACAIAALTRPPRDRFSSEQSSVPDAQVVRVLAAGNLPLVTDLYWIRLSSMTVQANLPPEGRALIAWAELITDLDDTMFWAYVVGGVLGPVMLNGKVYNAREAEALLQKGTQHLPQEARLYSYLAYTQIDLLKDYKAAAATLQRGAKVPGAPPFFAPLSTRLLAQTGEFDAAREFARAMAASEDPTTRAAFEERLRQIDQEELLQQIDAQAAVFTERMGRAPLSLQELVQFGLLPAEPVDPLGGTLSLDAQGRAVSSAGSRLQLFIPREDQ